SVRSAGRASSSRRGGRSPRRPDAVAPSGNEPAGRPRVRSFPTGGRAVTPNRSRLLAAAAVLGGLTWAVSAADPPKPVPKPAGSNDAELVERVIAGRKEYQQSLVALYDHYAKSGDRERAKWGEEELRSFH